MWVLKEDLHYSITSYSQLSCADYLVYRLSMHFFTFSLLTEFINGLYNCMFYKEVSCEQCFHHSPLLLLLRILWHPSHSVMTKKLEGVVKMTFLHTCTVIPNCASTALVITKIYYMNTSRPLVANDAACV